MFPAVSLLLLCFAATLASTEVRPERSDITSSQAGQSARCASLSDHPPVKRSDFTDHSGQSGGGGADGGVCAERLVALETLLQQQAATIQGLEARLVAMETAVQTGAGQQEDQSVVGFYADFGNEPFGDVTIPQNETVKFDRVLTNEGSAYNSDTGVFTAPVSGLYTFSLHFMGGQHTDATNLAIVAGNRTVAVAYSDGSGRDSNDQGSCTAVVHLHRSEEVSVQVEYGQPSVWGSSLTSFSGLLAQPSADDDDTV